MKSPSVRSRLIMLITVILVLCIMFILVPEDQKKDSLVYLAPAIVLAYGTFVTGETKRPSGYPPASTPVVGLAGTQLETVGED